MQRHYPSAAIAGLAAGLFASWAMELAQKRLAKLDLDPSCDEAGEAEPPSNQQAAVDLADVVNEHLSLDERKDGGRLVHYAAGAAMGVAYGLLAERDERVTTWLGAPLGLGSMLLLDEIAVPALGWGDPPDKAPPSSHLFSLASHLVFGAAAELTRRAVRGVLD